MQCFIKTSKFGLTCKVRKSHKCYFDNNTTLIALKKCSHNLLLFVLFVNMSSFLSLIVTRK